MEEITIKSKVHNFEATIKFIPGTGWVLLQDKGYLPLPDEMRSRDEFIKIEIKK